MCGQVFHGVKCEAPRVMEVGKCVSILQPFFLGQYRLRIIDRIDSTERVSILSLCPSLSHAGQTCSVLCICKNAVCLVAHNTLVALRDYMWPILRIHTPTMVISSGTAQALN